MADKQHFETRIRRFSGVRRILLNTTLGLRLANLALLGGAFGLLILSGWLPNPLVNLGLFAVLALFLLALLGGYALRRERFRSTLHETFIMEELAGGLHSRLISAWDFLARGHLTPLISVVIERAEHDLEFDFESHLERRQRNLRGKRFGVLAAVFLIVSWFCFGRAVNNFKNSLVAAHEYLFPVEYEVTPGYGRHIYKLGDEVKVSLHFKRRGYRELMFVTRIGEEVRRKQLTVDQDGRASQSISSAVEAEFVLHFEFGGRQTDEITLVFTTRPALVNMQTELIYPAYTRLLPRTLEGVQPRLLGLPGTRITLAFTFSKELGSATIAWDDGATLPLETLGRFASISLLHNRTRQASVQVEDTHGFDLESPLLIAFDLQKDERPRLFLPRYLKEDMPLRKEGAKLLSFGIRAQDDYGLTRCLLKWQRSTLDNPTSVLGRGEIERLISPVRRKAVVNFEKLFAGMTLAPGDKVSFQVEVHDNRAPIPQKRGSRRCSFFIYQQ